MQQTTLKVFNFALIFALALLTAYFTLENTASTTINIIPGLSVSFPIASLVIISAGVGACIAWFFDSWSNKLRGDEIKELEDTKKYMKELEMKFQSLKEQQQKNIAPVMSLSEENSSANDKEVA
ncbi:MULTISPECIES: LapA family protein [Prochlorococcus]|uniref:Uncharacterized membrane protein n=1 Tax=Prochlorococcus marinus (strain SARG / CCMP1375 / SS120) TaxID=167539 RepID=Q7VCS1_PROMA|nr:MULTISPECIES: LapA family protein [Prochlorococcus]AAP99713.1 Uncharacterized membrane protein [Prochlorococcus marinus subsp. marinus str. CCMP1375]KGG13386.1 hypothetical protein EV04_0621 [Prochlorococcus marinus str. LG]KGG21370.1 hypothetical protein EV08_0778 [Prochlorococcus marinus str. SS2]KGG24298.1 hypothetical protein EV09_0345 [Prochlorococcus marinus str. SS35]KGG33582.1 hypothetical protein EV10_0422 [Prochlorococcus marinus str. SS51]